MKEVEIENEYGLGFRVLVFRFFNQNNIKCET